MVHYSTNWMGPISTKWYEDRDVPFEMRETSGKILPKAKYKHFLKSYSCGRIDIYGLNEEEHWGGKSEYGLGVMETESWNILSDFLDDYESSDLISYDDLINHFETKSGHKIKWLESK